jgi:hypothetical protein
MNAHKIWYWTRNFIFLFLFFLVFQVNAHPIVRVCSSYLDDKSQSLRTRCGFGFSVLLNNKPLPQIIIVSDTHLTHGQNLKVTSLDRKVEIPLDLSKRSADNFSDLDILTPSSYSSVSIQPMFVFERNEPYVQKYAKFYFSSPVTEEINKLFQIKQLLTSLSSYQIPIVDPKFSKIKSFENKGTFFGNFNKIEKSDGQLDLPLNYLELDYVPNTELMPGMSGLPVVNKSEKFIDLIGITKLSFFGEVRSMVTPVYDLVMLIKKHQEFKFDPNSKNPNYDLDGFRWRMHGGITYREHISGIKELDQQTLDSGGGDGADAGEDDFLVELSRLKSTPSQITKWAEPSLAWNGISEKVIAVAFSPFQNQKSPPFILSPTFSSLRLLNHLGYFGSDKVKPITKRESIPQLVEVKKRQAESNYFADRIPIFCKINYNADYIDLSINSLYWYEQRQNPNYIKIRLNNQLEFVKIVSYPKGYVNLNVRAVNSNSFVINADYDKSQISRLQWQINTFGLWGIDPQTSEVNDSTVSISRYPYIRITNEGHKLFPRTLICEPE